MPAGARRTVLPPDLPLDLTIDESGGAEPDPGLGAGTGTPVVGLLLVLLVALLIVVLAAPGGAVGGLARGAIGFGFGWGSYLLPVIVAAFAAASIRASVEPFFRSGRLERPGWIVLFVALDALLQLLGGNPNPTWDRGGGGGLLGQAVWTEFEAAFGRAGGALLVGGVALFGLTLTLRLGVTDVWRVASRVPPLVGLGAGAAFSLAARGASAVARVLRGPPPRPRARAPLLDFPTDDEYADEEEVLPDAPAGLRLPALALTAVPSARSGERVWDLPPIGVLRAGVVGELGQAELARKVQTIEGTLADFDVYAKVVAVSPGPTVTQFGLEPGFRERRDRHGQVVKREKIKVNEIMALQNDLQLALAAPSVRIEAPVPGRQVVGLEVPNGQTTVVTLRQVMESTAFQKLRTKTKLVLALGEDVSGQPVAADLARAPHLLIAGATGSGKSGCINAIISCLLLQATPDEVRLILIDPKRVEMGAYNDVPHLLRPVVVDVDKVVGVLKWVVKEMDERYKLFESHGVRNIDGFNRLVQTRRPARREDAFTRAPDGNRPLEDDEFGQEGAADGPAGVPGGGRSVGDRPPGRFDANDSAALKPLPFIVVVVDELADLMMLAPDDTERLLCRLAQLARATGIHLVVATQRPSVDVITGLIKANFPTRISFAVTSQIDSRTILDMPGAEKLLGRGDMLFMPPDAAKPYRIQGTWVSDEEIDAVTTHWRTLGPANYVEQLVQVKSGGTDEEEEVDDLYDKAAELAHEHTRISTSLLQRRLRVGYTRAARLIDLLEQNGVIGPPEGGGRSREVHHDQRSEVE